MELLVPLGEVLVLQARVVVVLLHHVGDHGPQRRRHEEAAVLAAPHRLQRHVLPLELDDALALALAAVVHEDNAPLNVAEDAERVVQQLVGHPRALMRGECSTVKFRISIRLSAF